MGIKYVRHVMSMCEKLAAVAADLVEPHDPLAVAAFADKLCGLEGLDCDQLRERLRGVPIPGDFRHLQLHNLNTGLHWGGIYSSLQERLKLDQVIVLISCVIERDDLTTEGYGVWTATVALPVTRPGLLELGLRFKPLH